MLKTTRFILLSIFLYVVANAFISQSGGYKIGDKIDPFRVLDVNSDSIFDLSTLRNKKAVVLISHSLDCPYVNYYENRIWNIIDKYNNKDIAFVLVNSNNSQIVPEDKVSEMVKYIKQKNKNTVYLADKKLIIHNAFGMRKIPEIRVLKVTNGIFSLAYKGAIDNNPQVETDVSREYLTTVLNEIIQGKMISVNEVQSVGCFVKKK